ncbi:MAG TPA: hypothetical protein VEX13_16250 [Chloroflexia bacterium]|nr:hypothetical protein [Chloroflexia bacterium]
MKATIDNTYLVEGLDGTPDYFGVIITLKYGPKPAALQVSLPQFEPLRCDVVPLPADRKTIASVIDITRLSSLPPGPVHIKFRIKDVPETGGYGPPPDPDYDFVYDPRDDNVPEPTLVWKPCRQSFSPFIPFYKFDVNNQFPNLAVKHFYLRADFRVEANTQTVNMTGFVEFDTSSLGF